jgi:hypothetical protein
MRDIPFQRSIYHASADFAHRRMTHRSLGVGGYGFWGPRLRAVTLVEKDNQAGHFGVQARACPWGSIVCLWHTTKCSRI